MDPPSRRHLSPRPAVWWPRGAEGGGRAPSGVATCTFCKIHTPGKMNMEPQKWTRLEDDFPLQTQWFFRFHVDLFQAVYPARTFTRWKCSHPRTSLLAGHPLMGPYHPHMMVASVSRFDTFAPSSVKPPRQVMFHAFATYYMGE